MYYRFAAFTLLPILLAQGMYVRRMTPRLNEPIEPRQGTMGEGRPLRLLILGDSSAAGVGVNTQAEALAGQLVSLLAQRVQVSWRLMAKTGHTVQDTLTTLKSAPQGTFDVAVVAVGVNDVTSSTTAAQWQERMTNLCQRLEADFKVQSIFLTSIPPMHHFPALPQPLRWYLGKVASSLNQVTRHLTVNIKNWQIVEPSFPLTSEFMAEDGFHPSALAYHLWAKTMASAIMQNNINQQSNGHSGLLEH